MTQELYKKHRPKTLDRVVGNVETVAALRNMIEKKTLPHTVLFHGPSGCGKTTLARIIKDALGCHDLDYREINSSNNRGIDTIREIQQVMNLAPAAGPVRVWLFDECHKMTGDAQAAALKMMEDTPDHVYFFLGTTDPQMIIKTLRGRCCEMPVRLLEDEEAKSLLERVAKREKIELTDRTREQLLIAAAGSARVLLVLLDKIAALDESQREAAIESKLAEENEAIELCRALIKKVPWPAVTKILKGLKGEPETIRYSVLGYANSVMLGGRADKQTLHQAYLVMDIFKKNFFDSKMFGLTVACFEACNATE